MLLNREQILAANDINHEVVEVPEWGGAVRVRGLTALERDRLMATFFDLEGGGRIKAEKTAEYRVALAALGIVDEDGKRMFGDDDIAALGAKSPQAIERIADAVARLSGLTDVEELEKN
ncbi:MAG: hypothetical protein KatS3mg054_0660 [Chloroflexus sp.]|nr:MAG: hypothetical protein KatS3mg054_0660 [Chloroflexus sp.]